MPYLADEIQHRGFELRRSGVAGSCGMRAGAAALSGIRQACFEDDRDGLIRSGVGDSKGANVRASF
ncbi:hypothetical protein [Methylobacterium frigidaeris]|nr:hypothetical protein [Methylobacterium frigidaeris]